MGLTRSTGVRPMLRQPNKRQFVPPTDVIELVDQMLVVVEIAGMNKDDFNIVLEKRHLMISGTRQRSGSNVAAYHQVEIGYGAFRVDLDLPWEADRDAVTANYEHGFLTIELPRPARRSVTVVDLDTQEQDQRHER
jgi:HSP20 family protein